MGKIKYLLIDCAFLLFWGPIRIFVKNVPVALIFFISEIASIGMARLFKKSLAKTVKNVFSIEDEHEVRKIVQKSVEIYIKRNVENLFMGNLTKEYMEKTVSIRGIEYLNAALEKGNGVIIQLAHFGSFMTILPALSFRGYKINQIVGEPDLSRFALRWVYGAKVRENKALSINFIHVHQSVRPVIRALKRNELVAMALDGRDGKDWVQVPFLGKTANLAPGSVRIAAMTGASILPVFIIRKPGDKQMLVIEKPLTLIPHKDNKKFAAINMQSLAKRFDKYIMKYPCHFAMTVDTILNREKANLKLKPIFKVD
jgi:KDO2-lipid IV(A) lauroyltransferase